MILMTFDHDAAMGVASGGSARVAAFVAVLLLAGCEGSDSSDDNLQVVVDDASMEVARAAGVDLTDLVRRSAETARARLRDRGRVRIDVKQDVELVIPEIGVGGFTDPRNGNVVLAIADDVQREALETWIPAAVAHELHHSRRVRAGPGYGFTLGEALVTEGLADHFVSEVYPSTPPLPWDNAFPHEREAAFWKQAQRDLDIPGGYDHQAWFFGTGDLPRWAGYTLGYRIAGTYIKGRAASRAVKVTAEAVIEAYRKQRGASG